MMRAARLHKFGEPLRVDSVSEPRPGDGEALFTVAFAGVNPIDVWLTEGQVAGGRQSLPMIPGSDAVGFIDERPVVVHGGGVGITRDGLYAQRAVVPEGAVVDVPDSVELEQAAAVGVPGSTAWILAHELTKLSRHDRVLVLGCTGGVGSLLVQLAANAGAHVTGHTSSAEKAGFVRANLPCDLIVADAAGLAEAVGDLRPTVVFDPLGNDYTAAVIETLAPRADIILFGTSAGRYADLDLRTLYKGGASIRTYAASTNPPAVTRGALKNILKELAAGRLTAFVDDILPLEMAQDAHRRLKAMDVKGKVLLQP